MVWKGRRKIKIPFPPVNLIMRFKIDFQPVHGWFWCTYVPGNPLWTASSERAGDVRKKKADSMLQRFREKREIVLLIEIYLLEEYILFTKKIH